jgi:hypothetical protein
MTEPSPVRPGNAQFASVQAATVRLGHLILQTKRWKEAIRMADLKGAVAIARHYHAGSVLADDILRLETALQRSRHRSDSPERWQAHHHSRWRLRSSIGLSVKLR